MSEPGGPAVPVPDDDPRDPWAVHLDPTDQAGGSAGAVLPVATRRRRGALALVAAGVAAALVGGAGLAWAAFNGDTANQPERHLPAGTAALLKIDLDPSGGQKINAVRFLSKFPGGGGEEDLRKLLYDRLADEDVPLPPWEEVRDWLGDRAALAVLAPEKDQEQAPAPAWVLQVTDEARARTSLQEAAGSGAFVVADGWATLSDSKAHLDAVRAGVAEGTLADDATFRADTEALGDAGIAAAWADLSRLRTLERSSVGLLGGGLLGGTPADGSRQRVAAVARFTGGDAEVAVRTFGLGAFDAPADAGAALAALPADTVAAFGLSGGAETLRDQWPALRRRAGDGFEDALAQLGRQTGVRLPDDVAALLGRRVALALGPAGGSGEPVLGLRGDSDDAALGGALDRLLRLTDRESLPLVRRDLPGGYVLATTRQQADAMAGAGTLGEQEAFRDAVPDADRAQVVAYVDVERVVEDHGQGADEQTLRALSALRAVGMSAGRVDDGFRLTVRVTTR